MAQAYIQCELFRRLHVVLDKKVVVGVSQTRSGIAEEADRGGAVDREIVQVRIGDRSLEKQSLVVLIACYGCSELELVASLHPRKSIQPRKGISHHRQIEQRRTDRRHATYAGDWKSAHGFSIDPVGS